MSQPVFALILEIYVHMGGMTPPEIELAICRTRGKHVNH